VTDQNPQQPNPVPSAPAPVPGPPRPGPSPAGPSHPEPSSSHPAPDLGEHATGDIVIDAALQDLRDAPEDDLDARISAGRRVHQTLQGRLSHLGGE
jgi:hypothetical protein